MEIKSNGFFKGRTIGLDLYEDIDVFETTENLVLNFLVDNYDFDINDFNCVPYKFTDIDLDMIVWNYYVLYNTTKNKYFFLMSFYDVEDCGKNAVDMLKKMGYELKIEINTEEEIKMFKEIFLNGLKNIGFNSVEDFLEYYKED